MAPPARYFSAHAGSSAGWLSALRQRPFFLVLLIVKLYALFYVFSPRLAALVWPPALAAAPSPPPSASRVRALALTLVEGAAAAGREVVSLHARVAAERGAGAAAARGGDPVTAADERSGAVFAALDLRGAVLVSEEGVAAVAAAPGERDGGALLAFVDPLDATQEYTESLTQYVSLQTCVTACGRPLAAAIHFPFSGRTLVYSARAGAAAAAASGGGVRAGGAAAGGETATFESAEAAQRALARAAAAGGGGDVAAADAGACGCPAPAAAAARAAAAAAATAAALARAAREAPAARAARLRAALPPALRAAPLRIVVTRSHLRNESRSETGLLSLRSALRALRAAAPAGAVRIVRAGGAGYKLAALVAADADAYIHDGPIRQWDVCAGGALVRGAGGAVSDWTGADHAFCLPPRTAAGGKRAFAVSGIVAARDRDLHALLLDVIRGAYGDGGGADGGAAGADDDALV